jgi:hypothetical protein
VWQELGALTKKWKDPWGQVFLQLPWLLPALFPLQDSVYRSKALVKSKQESAIPKKLFTL